MAIYHVVCTGYKKPPTDKELAEQAAMMDKGFSTRPHMETWAIGRYAGKPEDGYHSVAWVKFKDLEAFRTHMLAVHAPNEHESLRAHVARLRAYEIVTPDEPSGTVEQVIQCYKDRWAKFPEIQKVLREDVITDFPYV